MQAVQVPVDLLHITATDRGYSVYQLAPNTQRHHHAKPWRLLFIGRKTSQSFAVAKAHLPHLDTGFAHA
jgi:hypothetical protein